MNMSARVVFGFWIATALFCVQMAFTVYAQLRLPQVAQEFTRLGARARRHGAGRRAPA